VEGARKRSAAEEAGFEVFVTADKKLPKQQNLKGRPLALVVLSTLDWEVMKPHLSKIVAAVDAATPGFVSDGGVWGVSAVDLQNCEAELRKVSEGYGDEQTHIRGLVCYSWQRLKQYGLKLIWSTLLNLSNTQHRIVLISKKRFPSP
jgi:hypothetical protein